MSGEQRGSGKVVSLAERQPAHQLAKLNRTTGLQFHEQPESLVDHQEEWEAFTEILLGRALHFWQPGDR